MKLFTLLMFLSLPALANDDKIPEIKQKMISSIDQRIAQLNSHKSCIQGAATREAMKSCQESHRAAMKKIKEARFAELKSMRQSMREKRKKN